MKYTFLKVSIPVLLLIITMFVITSEFIQPAPEKKLTIATGSKSGNYYKMAQEYKTLLEQNKIEVTLINTEGSVENIQLLKDKKADIAFVQNGILTSEEKNIEFLANIYYEPLWIFYKNDNYTIEYLIQLISKKISIGSQGSGTKDLATKILNDNGITNENSTILTLGTKESKQMLLDGKIDAMFMVTSHDSIAVKELLENPNINVLSIKRAKAYGQKYGFMEALTLHEGTLDLYKNIPDENINLLSTSANLLARPDVPAELIRIFLKQVKQVHQKESLFSTENQFPNLLNTNLKINKEAKQYFTKGDTWLESIFPYWIASNIDRLKLLLIPLLTLLFPLFKGVFPLYQWSMRSKIFRWYKILNSIDKQINTATFEELEKFNEEIKELNVEIQEETKVPLSYMGEYYDLMVHLELIQNKIKTKSNQIQINY
ncbi:MAG: TAXI family TRAP transporter solute-binding subunit [Arcobacter sp.]|uniref:TAXI family TRAP transporter solute-binding subunit n=1 Tax=Arcobacter sp. TaxID=1872629 RepID=UPI003B006002